MPQPHIQREERQLVAAATFHTGFSLERGEFLPQFPPERAHSWVYNPIAFIRWRHHIHPLPPSRLPAHSPPSPAATPLFPHYHVGTVAPSSRTFPGKTKEDHVEKEYSGGRGSTRSGSRTMRALKLNQPSAALMPAFKTLALSRIQDAHAFVDRVATKSRSSRSLPPPTRSLRRGGRAHSLAEIVVILLEIHFVNPCLNTN